MRFEYAALAALAATAQAFKDTSPFLLFSSSLALEDVPQAQLQTTSQILSTATQFLATCPSKIYYVIAQPHISSTDLSSYHTPYLSRALSSPSVKSKYIVPEAVGSDNWSILLGVLSTIHDACGEVDRMLGDNVHDMLGEKKTIVVLEELVKLPSSQSGRESAVGNRDARLGKLLGYLPEGVEYTVIYTSTPVNGTVGRGEENVVYESQFVDAVHADLKRDLEARVPPKTNETDMRPLFEKYQFLTPGIFMGLLVGIIMFTILSVGISAVSSLQVSYAAFDKEMGPAAQKKQQ